MLYAVFLCADFGVLAVALDNRQGFAVKLLGDFIGYKRRRRKDRYKRRNKSDYFKYAFKTHNTHLFKNSGLLSIIIPKGAGCQPKPFLYFTKHLYFRNIMW